MRGQELKTLTIGTSAVGKSQSGKAGQLFDRVLAAFVLYYSKLGQQARGEHTSFSVREKKVCIGLHQNKAQDWLSQDLLYLGSAWVVRLIVCRLFYQSANLSTLYWTMSSRVLCEGVCLSWSCRCTDVVKRVGPSITPPVSDSSLVQETRGRHGLQKSLSSLLLPLVSLQKEQDEEKTRHSLLFWDQIQVGRARNNLIPRRPALCILSSALSDCHGWN